MLAGVEIGELAVAGAVPEGGEGGREGGKEEGGVRCIEGKGGGRERGREGGGREGLEVLTGIVSTFAAHAYLLEATPPRCLLFFMQSLPISPPFLASSPGSPPPLFLPHAGLTRCWHTSRTA